MELSLEDLKEKSPKIWDNLPVGVRALGEKNFVVFFYWYDDAISKITDIQNILIVPKITLGLYKDMPFTKSGMAYSLGYFQLPFDTQSILFYQFISYFCQDKEEIKEFYSGIKQQDLQNIERKKKNTFYHNVFDVFTRDIFKESINRFILAEEVKDPIMTICDSVDSHLKQTKNKSLYGETISKVVMAIRNPNGGLIPERNGKLRYLYVGEKALEYSSDGTLIEAKEMLRNKFSVGEIYAKTNWYFNKYDNKWRKQISDAGVEIASTTSGKNLFMKEGSKFENSYDEILGYITGGAVTASKLSDVVSKGWDTYLSDILKHPTLYKNYPQLFNLPVFFATNKLSLQSPDSYDFYFSKDYMVIYGNPSYWDLKTVVLHETQHAIQQIERFATGGNDFIAKMIQAVGGSSIKNFFYLRKQINDVYKSGATLNGDYSYEKYLILYSKIQEKTPQLDDLSLSEEEYYKDYSSFCDLLTNLYQHPKLKDVVGFFLKPKITDSIDEIAELVSKASVQSHRMMAQGLTSRQVEKVFFETYEALAGEIEARDTQHISKLEESMIGYLLPMTSEPVDPEKVTVIIDDFISDAPVQSKIKAGVERNDSDGKYVIHLFETMSSEPLLHELGHIVGDIIGNVLISTKIGSAFSQETIEELGGAGEIFCEQFLSYILRQNISEDLSYDISNRTIEDKQLFDEELNAIFYIKSNPDQDKELMDRLNFISKLNELIYNSGSDIPPLVKYEGDVFDALEEIGEMDRSDAQGLAMPFEEFIKASFVSGVSARATAIKILVKTEVKSEGGSLKEIDYSGNYQDLRIFISDNKLQKFFSDLYKIKVNEWDDYTSGEFGSDEEVIEKLIGKNYKIFFNEDEDEFIITKKKTNKLDYRIVLSDKNYNKGVIDVIEESGIYSEYKPRFVVLVENKVIGGSTFKIDEDNIYNFDLGILDEYQGYGISKELIHKIISDAQNLAADEVKAYVVNDMLFQYLKGVNFNLSVDDGQKYAWKTIRKKVK